MLWLTLAALLAVNARACIWDADSLWHEKLRSHDLAAAILGEPPADEDTQKLKSRIQDLEAHRNEASAEWWNNLAGAHLRLNQPAQAAKILEPVMEKFPDDYGIHANLGTAYHLLGRYAEAEKEIARDLEINPDAHFGLEKYHLALLQYLMRDAKYQSRHVYVDEFTYPLISTDGKWGRLEYTESVEKIWKENAASYTNVAQAEAEYADFLKTNPDQRGLMEALGTTAAADTPPAYRTNWNLFRDTNFETGVIYMAQMNTKEPACFEMLGLAAWKNRSYHLAISAFQKAIVLGSAKAELLKTKIDGLENYIKKSGGLGLNPLMLWLALSTLVVLLYLALKLFLWWRRRAVDK